jgi:hypothetical protein
VVVSAHPEGVHYRAFLSYSHRDASFAARLHRRLEAYVLPSRLGANRRLSPIFKDREELPAARDLSDQVRAALTASDCLIVACSPAAAASPWVAREIETFRTLHPGRPILAALIQGEPTEAFPAVLYEGGVEPLAADFRKDGDGDRLAFLKLVAGIAGVGVDQLIQRDAQRRLRGVMAVTAVALVAVVAMGGMTFVALEARAEAERQRAEALLQRDQAEGLVAFMLTDLREGLKGVGSLALLTKVNRRALDYYAAQDAEGLSAESLLLRARVLQAMGEDYMARGDDVSAAARFEEAYLVSDRLLLAAAEDPERLFVHAQSAYWRGFVAYSRNQARSARIAWENYRTLAQRLALQQPSAVRSHQEIAFAEGALCSLSIEQEQNSGVALDSCDVSLRRMRQALVASKGDTRVKLEVATRLAWMADAEVLAGKLDSARSHRIEQAGILEQLLRHDPSNAEFLQNWGGAQRGLARIAYLQNDQATARRHLVSYRNVFLPLAARDPENRLWREQIAFADRALDHLNNKQDARNALP